MDVGVTEKEHARSRFDLKDLRDCGVKCWKERKMYYYVVREMAENYRYGICREVGFEGRNRSSHKNFTVNLGLANDLEWNTLTLHGLYYGVGRMELNQNLLLL